MSSKVLQENSRYEPESPSQSTPGRRDGVEGKSKAAEAQTDETPKPRSDNGASVDHIEDKPPLVVLNKKQKVMRHLKRFWVWYLIGVIILLAILLPVLWVFHQREEEVKTLTQGQVQGYYSCHCAAFTQ